MRPDRIPLFPLNVVLFPGEELPLHIFEPRYKRMVHECQEAKTPFGMLLAIPNGVVRVGCTAEITDLLKKYEDGRIDIATVGRAPFRVVELFTDDPLLEGRIEYLEDSDSALEPKMRQELVACYEICHTLLFSGIPKSVETALSEELSYRIAATLPLDLLWKQQLLEIRSEAERRERLLAYLREWTPHLQKTGALRRRAAGNGQSMN